MRYYIIAGEASGDLHGSYLIRALRKNDPDAHIRFWGGDLMSAEVGQNDIRVKHYNELAFMGVFEVVKHCNEIFSNLTFCKTDILDFKPDAVIMIDYPGFNLKIAKFAKLNHIKTIFYISPKIWAWNESRVKRIKRDIDLMLTIFPFEDDFYAKHQYKVNFVGNPLVEELEDKSKNIPQRSEFLQINQLEDKPIVALLAGSRKQELLCNLQEMSELAKQFPDYQFVIAGVNWLSKDLYQPYTSNHIRLIFDQTYALLRHSKAAVVVSGTATLETALMNIPQVVIYKTGYLSALISLLVIKIPFISLVNIIMNQEVVKEIIQFNIAKRAVEELRMILYKDEYNSQIKNNYEILRQKMGGRGASERAAAKIVEFVSNLK